MTTTKAAAHRSAFRAHHQRPEMVTSKLFGLLIDEWIELNSDPQAQQTISRLTKIEPTLSGHTRPCDIVDAIDEAPNPRKEEMFAALLRLFQSGHQLAGRILLQQMLPRIGKLTNAEPKTAWTWAEDRRHIAVAEFWGLAGTINLNRYQNHLIGNLNWQLTHILANGKTSRERSIDSIPCGSAEDICAATQLTTDATLPQAAGNSNHYTLEEILTWAVKRQTITTEDANLLTHIYIDGHDANQAATQFGISHALARKRCSRALKRIAADVQAQPAALAIA